MLQIDHEGRPVFGSTMRLFSFDRVDAGPVGQAVAGCRAVDQGEDLNVAYEAVHCSGRLVVFSSMTQ